MKIIITAILVFLGLSVFSQIQLSLLNGQQKTLESYLYRSDEGIDYLQYSYYNKNRKLKTSYSDCEDIYSLNINGKDTIFYYPTEEGEFSLPEMTQVVSARQLAIKDYNPWWSFASGVVVGCGSMFISTDGMTKVVVPILYTIGMGFAKPRENYIYNHYDYARGDEWFVYGYQNAGRKKIFSKTLLGEVTGLFLAGAIVGTLHIIENK